MAKKGSGRGKTRRAGDDPAAPQPTEAAEPLARPVMPIVAIGASAGGLEALKAFFSHVPVDCGIGFVVITHVQPERKSILPELLASVTKMPVVASEAQMRVAPGTVIVAKDALLTIHGGVLGHVSADTRLDASFHPIDLFFRSLAEAQQEHAIGIVLSGSGNDGTLGLKAIKAAGGLVMAQRPDTAKYASMPESAAGTGLVDYVLPPEDLPGALIEYVRGPFLRLTARMEAPLLPDDAIHAILIRLRNHSGQDFTCYKKTTISRRVQRRMAVHHLDAPRDYLTFLRDNPHELGILLQELLISVTSFFRDPEAFASLALVGLPPLLASRDQGHMLRVWVPGCATGEEAYSVAILLHEQARKAQRLNNVQIFATDIDERAIAAGRAAVYPEGIATDVSPERLRQYFTHEEGSYRIDKSIRDMVVFALQNVVTDPPFTRVDLIVCRNVLIYLDADAQQRILPTFHYALRPGGLLFLGSSESLGESSHLFETLDSRHKILRRKETTQAHYPTFGRSGRPRGVGGEAESVVPRGAPEQQLVRSVENVLLDEFVPCVAVVDERGRIVYIRGRIGMYLEPEQGQPRNNIVEMAREGLGAPLASALRHARESDAAAVMRGIRVRTNGETVEIDVRVLALRAPEPLRGLLLVSFAPSAPSVPAGDAGVPLPEEAGERARLEKELRYTRESLQTTIEELETSNEELKSSNEELQSTNEELQSTNEELETSKEEMQSLNEELNTVNAELQSKVEALGNANDDMKNLLYSMQLATIFLDRDLHVKRYTEKAKEIIPLIGTDIGRPISDLTSSLHYGELIEDCREVLATLRPKEREVQDDRGRWYVVRLMPYRTASNVIDGLVATIDDIDRARQAESAGAAALLARDLFQNIVQTIRQPLMVLDAQLRAILVNEAFHRAFRTHPEEVEGRLIHELGDGRWDIPRLRELLDDVLRHDKVMKDFRVEHDFPWIGERVFLLNARKLSRSGDAPQLILLAFEETDTRGTG